MLAQMAPSNQSKDYPSVQFFDGFGLWHDSDPPTSSVSLTMSAISFMSDALARTANDCSGRKSGLPQRSNMHRLCVEPGCLRQLI
jgi:hypothetical protein